MPVVPLAGLPAGTLVLIDANIFVYAFRELSTECERFLERCRAQQVFGATTLEVVNDVCHRLMLAEALDEGVIGRPRPRWPENAMRSGVCTDTGP